MAADAVVEVAKIGLSNSALAYIGGGIAIGVGAMGGAIGIGNIFGKAIESRRASTRSPAARAAPHVHRLRAGGSAGALRLAHRVHSRFQINNRRVATP